MKKLFTNFCSFVNAKQVVQVSTKCWNDVDEKGSSSNIQHKMKRNTLNARETFHVFLKLLSVQLCLYWANMQEFFFSYIFFVFFKNHQPLYIFYQQNWKKEGVLYVVVRKTYMSTPASLVVQLKNFSIHKIFCVKEV